MSAADDELLSPLGLERTMISRRHRWRETTVEMLRASWLMNGVDSESDRRLIGVDSESYRRLIEWRRYIVRVISRLIGMILFRCIGFASSTAGAIF